MGDDEDIRDAAFFRLWIRLASQCPSRVAIALAPCAVERDYRMALSRLAREERINLPPARIDPELIWLGAQKLPMWGGHLERGEPVSDPMMRRWITDGIIEAVSSPRPGYVLTDKGRELIEQH